MSNDELIRLVRCSITTGETNLIMLGEILSAPVQEEVHEARAELTATGVVCLNLKAGKSERTKVSQMASTSLSRSQSGS